LLAQDDLFQGRVDMCFLRSMIALVAALAAIAAWQCSFVGYLIPDSTVLHRRGETSKQLPARHTRVCLRGGHTTGAGPAPVGGLLAVFALGTATLATVRSGRSAQRGPRTMRRALTEIGSVKLNLMAGKATPAPPVGPALGQFGANIAFFVKEYNAITADKAGNIVPVIVHVMSDRSFTLELKTPPTAALIHKAVGKDKGSGKAGTEIIGKISVDKLREIAEVKLEDLTCSDITRAMKVIHGTCVASGVEVEGYDEWLETVFKSPASILDRYGPGKANLPPPFNE